MSDVEKFNDSVYHPKFWMKRGALTIDERAPKRVKSVQMKVLSSDMIRKLSVCTINQTSMYEKNVPKENSINDLRLGTSDCNMRCKTCKSTMTECIGHSGLIELPLPVFHISYIGTIVKILRSVCHNCYEVVMTKDDPFFLRAQKLPCKQRFHAITQHSKMKKVCPNCNHILPNIKPSGFTIKRVWPAKIFKKKEERYEVPPLQAHLLQPLTPGNVKSLLLNISHKTYNQLGLKPEMSHPSHFILDVLYVPPVPDRPSIVFGGSARQKGQDDLTNRLQEIYKTTIKLQQELSKLNQTALDKEKVQTTFDLLQNQTATYMNNESSSGKSQSKKRSGLPEKSVVKRLKGKKGRCRGHLMGKRVNFSARSPIVCDAELPVEEIGVPRIIASKLTYPEMVNKFNMDILQAKVNIGFGNLEGAHSVELFESDTISLEFCQTPPKLTLGSVVHRYLRDGDYVLFNRQPTLRKKSIMAHRVKLMNNKAFRLNESATTPYNADFDGGTIFFFVLQNIQACTEAKELLSIPKQLMNAQNCKPIMGIVQDALLGAHCLTKKDTFLNKAQFMNLMMTMPNEYTLPIPAILKPQQLWTGKQIMSFILPKITMTNKETDVLISHGELLTGTLCKKTLGATSGGIIHQTCKILNSDIAIEFMNACQRLCNQFLETQGFSMGLSDCLIDEATDKLVQSSIQTCLDHVEKVENLGKSLNVGFAQKEQVVQRILGQVLAVAGSHVQKAMQPDNAFGLMVQSSSKGSIINIAQVSGLVGNQSVDGMRIMKKNHPEERSLNYYPRGCQNPQSRGFCANSYIKSLPPCDFFTHAQSGREGLIATSAKTSIAGYIHRRITVALESICIRYDSSARDAQGNMVQEMYGDGFDGTYMERIDMFYLKSVNASQFTNQEYVVFDRLRKESIKAKISILNDKLDVTAYVPINIEAILLQHFPVCETNAVLTKDQLFKDVSALLFQLQNLTKCCTLFMRTSFAYFLRFQNMQKYSLEIWQNIVSRIEYQLQRALVEPGEMVGNLTAESIGEPILQICLNTFHSCGIASLNINLGSTNNKLAICLFSVLSLVFFFLFFEFNLFFLGIPRLIELIDAQAKNKTPYTMIVLKEPFCFDKNFVMQFKGTLNETFLKDLLLSSQIVYSPNPREANESETDLLLTQFYSKNYHLQPHGMNGSQWVIRLVLDKTRLASLNITIKTVQKILRDSLPNKAMYHMLCAEQYMPELVIRIRMCCINDINKKDFERKDFEKNMANLFLTHLTNTIYICGIQGLHHACMHESDKDDPETLERKTFYGVQVGGLKLMEVWDISVVDWKRTWSNNVIEILETLGIEAASHLLFNEIKQVLSFESNFISSLHIMILVDFMSFSGTFTSVNRHGLNNLDTGFITKMAFEEIVSNITEAGIFAETNVVNSIADNIIFGNLVSGGTGIFSLVGNEKYLQDASKTNDVKKEPITRTYYSHFANDDFMTKEEVLSPLWIPEDDGPQVTSPKFFNPQSPTYQPSDENFISFVETKDPHYQPSTPNMKNISKYHPSSPVLFQESCVNRNVFESEDNLNLFDSCTGELKKDRFILYLQNNMSE